MKIIICSGSSCTMMGSDNILDQLEEIRDNLNEYIDEIDQDFSLDIEIVHCLGLCKKEKKSSPVAILDGEIIQKATPQVLMEKILDEAFASKFES